MMSPASRCPDWKGPTSPLAREVEREVSRTLEAFGRQPSLAKQQAEIERDTAGGGYARRQLYELVQNSADAIRGGHGGRILIKLTGTHLYCADDGKSIALDGVKALMFSRLSTKRAIYEIGRFGLGFKSVLRVTDSPDFISCSVSLSFDKQRAEQRLRRHLAEPLTHYPLFPFPEPFDPQEDPDEHLQEMMGWAMNIVRLPLKSGSRADLRQQVERFPPEFLLFVDHVKSLTLEADDLCRELVLHKDADGVLHLSDHNAQSQPSPDAPARWRCFKKTHVLSDRARDDAPDMADDSDKVPIWWAAPVDGMRQDGDDVSGRYWAFFPTTTPSLLGGILNAPWRTDSNRQNLLEGRYYNDELVGVAASLVADSLREMSAPQDPAVHLDLLPRRHEKGDHPYVNLLRDRLSEELSKTPIVPDQDGRLRELADVRYPPDLPRKILDVWEQCTWRPREWLHGKAVTRDRLAKIDRLRSGNLNEQKPSRPVRRESFACWLESLVKGQVGDEAVVASKTAINIAAMITGAPVDRFASLLESVVERPGDEAVVASKIAIWIGASWRDLPQDGSPGARTDRWHALAIAATKTGASVDHSEFGEIVLTQSGAWKEPGSAEVFVLEEKEYDGFHGDDGLIVHRDVACDPLTLGLLVLLGVQWMSPAGLFKAEAKAMLGVGKGEACGGGESWDKFWRLARPVDPQEACRVITACPREPCVRTIKGTWQRLRHVLLPGCVVPYDGTRDAGFAIDTKYHQEDMDLLRSLGASEGPRGCVELADSTLFLSFLCDKREEFRRSVDGKPRTKFLVFDATQGAGPLDLMEYLTDEGKAQYTTLLLDHDDTYARWTMRHKSRPGWGEREFDSLTVHAILKHGLIDFDGRYATMRDLRTSPQKYASALRTLMTHPKAEQIRDVFGLDYPHPEPIGPNDVDRERDLVRRGSSDEERLLLAVGREGLQSRLGRSVLAAIEPLTPAKIAKAAIARYHTGALKEYQSFLTRLEPPSRWAGSAEAREFVCSLGFPEEWAGERGHSRRPFQEVNAPHSLPKLHGYQKTIVDNIHKMLLESAGGAGADRRGMMTLPTGAGKTRAAVEAIVTAMDKDLEGSILWVADRDELCEQAVQAWCQVWSAVGPQGQRLRVSRMWGGQSGPEPGPGRNVVVATPQTLRNKVDVARHHFDFSVVVFDEAHRSTAPTATSVQHELGVTRWKRSDEPFLIGLTATPYRGQSKRETARLADRYDHNRLDDKAFPTTEPESVVRLLQEHGILAKADHQAVEGAGEFVLTKAEKEELDSTPHHAWLPRTAEQRLAADLERTERIVDAYKRYVAGHAWSTLVFATSVDHSHTIATLLNLEGIRARSVSGETETYSRRLVVEEFRRGEVQVLVNYRVFAEGFDAPNTRVIMVARPVYSPNLYFQMIGRGLRGPKNGGNERCLIINVEDNIRGFGRELAFSGLEWLWDR